MEQAEQKKTRSKKIWTIIFVVFNILVIGAAAYMDFGTEEKISKNALLSASPWYLTLAFGLFLVTIGAETVKYKVMLNATGGGSWRTAFEVGVLGKYYDNITPFGAGGQPFQIVYLSREGIANGPAAAIPLAGYVASHAAFLILAVAVLISGFAVQSAVLIVPAIVGLLCYAAIPAVLVLFAVFPNTTERFIGWGIGVLGKMHILKDPEAKRATVFINLRSAIASIRHIGRRVFRSSLALSLVFQIAVSSMPFFVLRAFGNDMGYFEVFRSCVYIYLCVTFIPTPGNAGAAEGSFYALFSVLGQGGLFWAMLVWRFFCFYCYIILGFIVTFIGSSRRKAAARDEKSRSETTLQPEE